MTPQKRKTLLVLASVGLGLAAFQTVPGLLPRQLGFRALDDPPGFRVLTTGGETSTAGFDPFVGLSQTDPAQQAARDRALVRVRGDVCGALFGSGALPPGRVPIASFSDYYCPYCRAQTGVLVDLAKRDDLHLVWHELPLFGETSQMAARAALAAKRQGAYLPFHDRMMGSPFRANPAYLAVLAGELGLDAAQLQADMASDAVQRQIDDSTALARIFGIAGTPALIIGRTVVQGQVDDRVIRQIISDERNRPGCLPAG